MKNILNLTLFVCLYICSFISVSAQQAPIKVACVGNSITYGLGIKDQVKDSYPAVLHRMLGDNYSVRNFGRSGNTLLRKGNRPYNFSDALNYGADIVIIKLGTNDAKPVNSPYMKEFEGDLSKVIDDFRNCPSKPRIFLCKPVPIFMKAANFFSDSALTEVIIPQIEKVALKNNIELIDLYAVLKPNAQLFPDKVHPNKEGALLIAKTIYSAIIGKEGVFVEQSFAGIKTQWKGFNCYKFDFQDRTAIVVEPKVKKKNSPWIFRPAFFGSFAAVDSALLHQGFHIAYLDVTNLYGSPRSEKFFNAYYKYLVDIHGFSPRVTLEGFSRGGLFVFNWAAHNPEKVACIYADAPVCNVKSWPGRERKELWAEFLKEYRIKDEQADTLQCNPIDKAQVLAKNNIPIICVYGDADKVVPFADNAALLRNGIKNAGGKIKIVRKHGVDHHPHSLKKPDSILKFILKYQ